MRALFWISRLIAVAFVGCSTTAADDGGMTNLDATKGTLDAPASAEAAADARVDSAMGGCTVATCYGMVVIPPGGSVPNGDTCGTLCTCECMGLCFGKCSWMPGCYCDAGGQ